MVRRGLSSTLATTSSGSSSDCDTIVKRQGMIGHCITLSATEYQCATIEALICGIPSTRQIRGRPSPGTWFSLPSRPSGWSAPSSRGSISVSRPRPRGTAREPPRWKGHGCRPPQSEHKNTRENSLDKKTYLSASTIAQGDHTNNKSKVVFFLRSTDFGLFCIS